MAKLSPDEFEALWQSCQQAPVVHQATTAPVQLDLSLSGMLDQYLAMASRFLAQGKINPADHGALIVAVADLKLILNRINDKGLIKEEMALRAKAALG